VHRFFGILAVLTAFLSLGAPAAFSATPVAQKSSFADSPWIDQYIEQIPGAGGGLHRDPRTGAWIGSSGLSGAELAALAAAGGQRFAGAMAAGTPPISQAGGNSTEDMSKLTSTLAETLLPTGDTGLGIALPILLIGSLIGGIAIAGSRKKSARS